MDVGHCAGRTASGHNRFLVIVDNGGGKTRVYPMKRETSKIALKHLCKFLTDEEAPETDRTDNATVFTSAFFEQGLSELGLTHVCSIPYKSNTNGVAERAVGLAKQQIYVYGREWDKPVNLLKINQNLSRPKLKNVEEEEAEDTPVN